MSRPINPATRTKLGINDDRLFTVTVEREIGSVYANKGTEHPEVVAFKLIGQHAEPGTYRFPREDGSLCVVAVEHRTPGSTEDVFPNA